MSRKDRILEQLTFDKSAVKGLIESWGEIKTLEMMKPCFTDGPHSKRVPDTLMRQMIWNMIQSLEALETTTKMKFLSIDTIHELSKATKDIPTRTISRHIIGGVDTLNAHLM